MSPRTLLILFLLVAGLTAFIWFVERDLPSSEERSAQAGRVVEFDPEEIVRLEIERGSQRTVLERRPAGQWRMSAPYRGLAESGRVSSLLAALGGLQSVRTLADPDREALGLEPAGARLELVDGTTTRTLLIGAELPASTQRVVAMESASEAFVVEAEALEDVFLESGAWRSREMFSWPRSDIVGLLVTSALGTVRLERRDDDFWIIEPLEDRASEGKATRLQAAVAGLRVEQFLESPDSGAVELGLDPARGIVEVSVEGHPEPVRIEIGGPVPETEGTVYVRMDDQTFEAETTLPEFLSASAQDWRSPKLSSREIFQVDRVTVTEAGQPPLELVRSGANWDRDGQEVDYEPVESFLEHLLGIRADLVLSRAQAVSVGASLEATMMRIEVSGNTRSESLRILAAAGDHYACREDDRDAILMVSEDQIEGLLERLSTLRRTPVRDA